MLIAKRFYCLFPLACIVLHPIMFSMALMDNLAGQTNELLDLNLVPQADTDELHDLSLGTNTAASSSQAISLDNPGNGSQTMERNPIIKELVALINFVKGSNYLSFRPLQINSGKFHIYKFHNYIGKQILDMFFEESPFLVHKSKIYSFIPLFEMDGCAYVLFMMDNDPFLISATAFKTPVLNVYGKIKPSLTVGEIQEWRRQNNLL